MKLSSYWRLSGCQLEQPQYTLSVLHQEDKIPKLKVTTIQIKLLKRLPGESKPQTFLEYALSPSFYSSLMNVPEYNPDEIKPYSWDSGEL